MRKLFLFLCAALMSVGMYATTVTWNNDDITGSGKSFTKDGVTITAGMIDFNDKNFMRGGTFTTTLGNFTQIEVTAGDVAMLSGEGWSGNSQKKTWTGNASSVSFSGDIMGMGGMMGTTKFVFTIEEPAPTTYTLQLVADPEKGSVAVTNLLGSDIVDNGNGNYTVPENTKVTILATPNEGYAFTGWLEGNVLCDFIDCGTAINTLDNPLTFTLTQDAACKAEFEAVAPAAKYYIVGTMNSWQVDENYEMNPSLEAETEEYFYTLDLTTTSEFKVVKVQNGQQSWIPDGMGNNYGQNGEITEDGEYTVYFRPNYDGGEDWFYNCIYVSKNEPEPAGEVTVVFAANDKTAERTVTLPHTFKCDWAGGMERPDELDIIIHELYNDYYYCNSNMNASGSDQVEAGTEEDPKNDYITIKGVFEGTATVTGDYLDYIAGDYGEHNYSITISIKGDEPQSQETVVTITEADYVSGNTITKDGVTLTANQIYGVGSWYVEGPGTFTNTIGNFTKIEVTTVGGSVFIEGDGWTGDWDKKTWTGNAPSVSFTEDIFGKGQGFSIVCTIESQGEPTGVENVQTNPVQATKFFRDGMIYIVRDGKLFNMTGAQVK